MITDATSSVGPSAVPPVGSLEADSTDGRVFTYGGSGTFTPAPGDMVILEPGDQTTSLGQVQTCDNAPGSNSGGQGLVLGVLDDAGAPQPAQRRPFRGASLMPAMADHLERLQASAGGDLKVGTWRSGELSAPGMLRAQGFNRHTFMCGQSGSGKTYALGVILEQLLLDTELRMLVLDPNADFVRLGEPRPDAPAAAAERIRGLDVRVLGGKSPDQVRLRFRTMSPRAQAAVLMLDPLADREEYNLILRILQEPLALDLEEVLTGLRQGERDERRLAQRIENLGLSDWEIWARDQPSTAEVVATGARATVADLSGLRDPRARTAVGLDLIESLWADRESRTPTLIVIDEAHNLCPAEPEGPLQEALVSRLIQIAAEGRKYGLWLMLSTQRPSKVHPQVVSQCDNLALMRMNSPGDVVELAGIFGFAPPAMLGASPFFMQGEAIFAGGFVSTPSFFTMGSRLTHEGGGDVRVPVAAKG